MIARSAAIPLPDAVRIAAPNPHPCPPPSPGTWAGSLWAPLALVAGGQDPESQGLNPLVPALQQDSLKSLLRSTPVLPFLAPAPAVFGDQPMVEDATSGKRYSAAQIGGWLRDSGAQQASNCAGVE